MEDELIQLRDIVLQLRAENERLRQEPAATVSMDSIPALCDNTAARPSTSVAAEVIDMKSESAMDVESCMESDSLSENDSEKRGKQEGERNMKRRCKRTEPYFLSTPNKKSQDKGTDPKKNPNSSQYLRQKSEWEICEAPVTCGDKNGIFYMKKYFEEQKCILSEGQWFKPSEFEKFGGKERNKKWKTSILSNGIPVQKLIERSTLFPCTSESSGMNNGDDDVDEEENDDDDDVEEEVDDKDEAEKKDDDVEEEKEADDDDEEEEKKDDDDDVDEEDDDDLTVFGPTLPVTYGSKSGIQHKCRFATGLTFSSGPLNEELQCSLCLDAFTDPVTIPCGHNFCKSCLNQCWDKSEACCCLLCKETFSKRPDLKINTALRQVVQLFKEKSCLTKPDVLCDFCDENKQKALKSCLICWISYCEPHLEPHQRVPGLKKHKLINAVKNLEESYKCQKHKSPLELFCRDDQTFVCLSCTDGDHKTHNTVPLEEESEEKKTQVMKIQTEVQQIIQDRIKKIKHVTHSAELRKQNTEKEIAESIELFMAMARSIERCQAEQLEMMEQKQKAAEKQEEKLIEELQQEITELKQRNAELEQLSHTEDHLHLLQIYPSLRSPFNIKKWPDINVNTPPSLENLRKALTHLQKTLDEKLSENGN